MGPRALLILFFCSCGDDNVVMRPDGGRDAGPIDSGSLPDAGFDAIVDRGTCDDPRTRFPADFAPRCYATTETCIRACDGMMGPALQSCRQACFAADAFPSERIMTMGGPVDLTCALCNTLQLLYCVDSTGCHAQLADYLCCVAEMCPAGSPPGCGPMRCAAELAPVLSCAPPSCFDYSDMEFDVCFSPDAMPDAGPDGTADASAAPDAGTDGGM
jgi:hypothetical protein